MATSNVLIVGMKGLGVEIGKLYLLHYASAHHSAKNVALAGVKSVTVYDPAPVEVADLGTQVSFEGVKPPFQRPQPLRETASDASSSCARRMSASRVRESPPPDSPSSTPMFPSACSRERVRSPLRWWPRTR